MIARTYPALNTESFADTRDALHTYAKILGDCLKACRHKRKHWWHASLRPSLNGIGTGVVRASQDFELELDLRQSTIHARSNTLDPDDLLLNGQSASEVADWVVDYLRRNKLEEEKLRSIEGSDRGDDQYERYAAADAQKLNTALASAAASLEQFRAGLREEQSPVQLWPHHFDLSMIWLPGEKIPGQDPKNEEYSDKQMNFGLTFGDQGIPEPYFYVTAYPVPDALSRLDLPKGAEWKTEGFTGAVVAYSTVVDCEDPNSYLQRLWGMLVSAGREHMLNGENTGATR